MRATLAAALFLLPLVAVADGFFAYARVVETQPVTVSERVPEQVERCERAAAAGPAGDARRDDPAATPGELIAADNRRRAMRCRTETVYRSREKIVAWRVRYTYGGEVYERRLAHRPGERIRVRVDLRPR